MKIEDYGREKRSEGVVSIYYYDERGASAQYGEVTQNTEIFRTAYGLRKSLVGGTGYAGTVGEYPGSPPQFPQFPHNYYE